MSPGRRAALTLVVVFATSAAIAGVSMAWMVHVFMTGATERETLGQRTVLRVEFLELLQAGATQELIDKLERKIDGCVGQWDRDPGVRGNDRVEVAIEKVRAYRANYPRVTADPQKDAAVKRVLDKR